MSTAETLRDRIYTAIASVSNIGPVFKKNKIWIDSKTFEETDACLSAGVVRFAMLLLATEERKQQSFGATAYTCALDYTIHLYRGFDESGGSEAALLDVAEDVMDALDSDTTLHEELLAAGDYEAELSQMTANDLVTFNAGIGYTCNHVVITKRITKDAP